MKAIVLVFSLGAVGLMATTGNSQLQCERRLSALLRDAEFSLHNHEGRIHALQDRYELLEQQLRELRETGGCRACGGDADCDECPTIVLVPGR